MRRTRLLAALAVAAATAVACSTGIRVDKSRPQYAFAPTCAAGVAVYGSFADVPADYYEIALITAEGNAVWTTNAELEVRMREEAAEVGANGIVADANTSATAVKVMGAVLGTGDADRKGRAVAIRMPSQMDRVRTTCGVS